MVCILAHSCSVLGILGFLAPLAFSILKYSEVARLDGQPATSQSGIQRTGVCLYSKGMRGATFCDQHKMLYYVIDRPFCVGQLNEIEKETLGV